MYKFPIICHTREWKYYYHHSAAGKYLLSGVKGEMRRLGAGMEEIMRNKGLDCIALTIAIIGAVNWGLVGIFDFNLVAFLFGSMSWLSRLVYILVGLCGLYLITFYGSESQPA